MWPTIYKSAFDKHQTFNGGHFPEGFPRAVHFSRIGLSLEGSSPFFIPRNGQPIRDDRRSSGSVASRGLGKS